MLWSWVASVLKQETTRSDNVMQSRLFPTETVMSSTESLMLLLPFCFFLCSEINKIKQTYLNTERINANIKVNIVVCEKPPGPYKYACVVFGENISINSVYWIL